MESLRVPKRTASIEVTLLDGLQRKLEIFLAESSPTHSGPERVSDLIQAAGAFVPALDPATGRVTWLNTGNIAQVRVSSMDEHDDEVATLPMEHEVEVTIATGGKVRGLISYTRPDDHSRLTDFLNDGPPFIRILDGNAVVFVNKRHAVCVMAEG